MCDKCKEAFELTPVKAIDNQLKRLMKELGDAIAGTNIFIRDKLFDRVKDLQNVLIEIAKKGK